MARKRRLFFVAATLLLAEVLPAINSEECWQQNRRAHLLITAK